MSTINEKYCEQDLCFGIDQSLTSSGWCVTTMHGEIIDYGVVTSVPQGKEVTDTVNRCKGVVGEILRIIRKFDNPSVVIEGLALGNIGGNSSRDLAGLQFMIVSNLLDHGYEVSVIPPTQVKKFATGKGNAKKDDMVSFLPPDLREKIEGMPKSKGRYDVTDAYWLSRYGFAKNIQH